MFKVKLCSRLPFTRVVMTVFAIFSVIAVIISVCYYYLDVERSVGKFNTVFEWNYVNFTWESQRQQEEVGYVPDKFEVVFEWNYVNFTWISAKQVSLVGYRPGEDVITGIKVFEDVVYLTLMRNKTSARVTVASVFLNAEKVNPLLTPYPNWEMNTGDSCSHLQDVLSLEVDRNGILWVLDGTRRANLTQCPAKLVLFDTRNAGEIVHSFEFPETICSVNNRCFLDDIVLDGDWAFITDTTASDPGLVVYNRVTNSVWKARDSETMRADPAAYNFTAQGVQNTMMGNINGIAMNPPSSKERRLFYTPQMSFHIYSLPVDVLKDEQIATGNISEYIIDHGRKLAATDGMIGDSQGNIYFGLSPLDQVNRWDTLMPLDTSTTIERNHDTLRWPDGFSVNKGYVYVVTNSMLRFKEVGIINSLDQINFRVLRYFSGTESYQYSENWV